MSPLASAGNCAWGKLPVAMSDAETVTFPLRAWPFTVVAVETALRLVNAPAAVVAPVPPLAKPTVPVTLLAVPVVF
jgi:hypothetical protein